jgi:hypothetical protein
MSTWPAASGGETAVIEVEELTVKLLAATVPKETLVAPVKLVPVMLTDVLPPVLPLDVPKEVTVAAEAAVYVKLSLDEEVDVPVYVVTVTSTTPAACGGLVAVMEVAEFTVKELAATEPNLTAVAPVKFVPVITTEVPPAVVPVLVPKLVTVGVVAPV